MRIVSWNVNGLRAVWSRKDLDWAFSGDVDVLCLQETKIQEDQVTDEMRAPPGFRSFWSFGKKKGYSGTAIFVRDTIAAEPVTFRVGGAAHPEYDEEGRVVAVDLGACVVLDVYFPNGGSSDERLAFKHAWHDAFLAQVEHLAKSKSVIVLGDFNVAHRPIDVALPEKWHIYSGFLPVERAWLDRLLAAGFVDTFRAEKGDLPRQFTFWETRTNARAINEGWRIDYVVTSKDLEDKLVDAWIWPQITGSDHCPVGAELELPLRTTARADWSAAGDASFGDAFEDEDEDGGFRR